MPGRDVVILCFRSTRHEKNAAAALQAVAAAAAVVVAEERSLRIQVATTSLGRSSSSGHSEEEYLVNPVRVSCNSS